MKPVFSLRMCLQTMARVTRWGLLTTFARLLNFIYLDLIAKETPFRAKHMIIVASPLVLLDFALQYDIVYLLLSENGIMSSALCPSVIRAGRCVD